MKDQFFKFICVGLLSTIFNYLVFFLLYYYFSIFYLISSGAGFLSGVFLGYIFNRAWTFEYKTHTFKLMFFYTSIYCASLLLSLAFLKIVVDYFNVNVLFANVLAIGITTCTNFIGLKYLVFKTN